MKYRLNKNSVKRYFTNPLWGFLFFNLVLIAVLLFFSDKNVETKRIIFAGVFIGQSFFFLVPLTFYFLKYRALSRNIKLEITNNVFTYSWKDREVVSFTMGEIELVELFGSPSAIDNKSSIVLWDKYFYYKLWVNQSSYIIPCLVCDNLEEYLPEGVILKKNYSLLKSFPKARVYY